MPLHTYANAEYVLIPERPELHSSPEISAFIEQEVVRPSKQWVRSVIAGEQEKDQVILRTGEFIILPDTERANRHWRNQQSLAHRPTRKNNNSPHCVQTREWKIPRITINWLGILLDLNVRTLRDLRGHHIPTLQRLWDDATSIIEKQTGIQPNQVMAYVHYPPSVYQLHVHLAYPYGQFCQRDAYRIHSLQAIISNLEIDPMYYAKATLLLPIFKNSLHYMAICEAAPEQQKKQAQKGSGGTIASPASPGPCARHTTSPSPV
jgi:m7GpppX diphosphatase